jgi:hypothetical protein
MLASSSQLPKHSTYAAVRGCVLATSVKVPEAPIDEPLCLTFYLQIEGMGRPVSWILL